MTVPNPFRRPLVWPTVCRQVHVRAWRFLGTLAFVLFAMPSARACDADTVLTLMERRIQSFETIRIDYSKDSHSLLFGERPTEKGKLWLNPPKRYRVETKGQVYVRGFDTLWAYNAAAGQVTVRVGGLDSLEFGPVGFFGSLRTDFISVDCRLDSSGKQPHWWVRLVAKTETAAIQRLTLWINTGTHWPDSLEYVDYNEETSRLRFTHFRPNQPKDRQRFTFSPPSHAEVIVLPTKKTARKHDSVD